MKPVLLDRQLDLHPATPLEGANGPFTLEAALAIQLPADRAHAATAPVALIQFRGPISASCVAKLQAYGSANDSLAEPLLAAFALFLARIAGQPTISLHRPAHQPLSVDLDGAPSFLAMLARLRSHNPAAATPLAADTPVISFRYWRETAGEPAPQPSRPTGELQLSCTHTAGALQLEWTYHPGRFNAATIRRLHRQFRLLLSRLAEAPTMPVADIPLMTSDELHRLLVVWNATAAPYPSGECIHHLFEQQVHRQPDAPALAFDGELISYAELDARANQLAHYLRRLGVGPEVLVGLGVERSVQQIVGLLAILKAGGAYLPLDPTYPAERLAFMLADAHAPILLTTRASDLGRVLTPEGEAEQDFAARPAIVLLDADWPRIAYEPTTPPSCGAGPDSLAYVIYTSGSTGRPKGTLLAHRGLCSLVAAQERTFALGPGQRVLQFASCSFDASVWEWVMALCTGATLCLARSEQLASPADLLRLLAEQAITIATLPPSLLAILPIDHLPDLHTIITAGEACNHELVARWAPGRALYNAYGPTETTICATWHRCDPADLRNPPIGRPLPNMQLYILDQHRRPVPVGVPGELYIGGFALARGYLNRPELTGERFIEWEPPSAIGAAPVVRLYKTGDLARYCDDGAVEFLGRIDHQVKLRGFRIELSEIESALRLHVAVADAVVLAREDTPGVQRLVAYLIMAAAASDDRAEPAQLQHTLRAFLAEQLPEFMLPSAFVPLPAFPTTPNGKIDRRALPVPPIEAILGAGAAPRTPDETVLADIWAEVLGRPHVGIDEDFFALGGHSLLAARTVALVSRAFNREIMLRTLYEAPTVAAFAAALSDKRPAATSGQPLGLAAEVALDPTIFPSGPLALPPGNSPAAVLLTGATGFLGAALLHELLAQTEATIYCLVRAGTRQEADQRLRRTLIEHRIELDAWPGRVVPVPGDLRGPRFGLGAYAYQHLADEVEMIVHAGAQVHYLYPFTALKATNVQGTVEVLRLACQGRLKPVHYISSIAAGVASGSHVVHEDAALPPCESAKGYDQSKWVAEAIARLARERGVPLTIYRPGRIGAHSRTGASNRDDFFVRLLAACLQLGLAPDIPLVENLLPVDFAAQAIVYLSSRPTATGRVFHLMNPQPTSWHDVVTTMQQAGFPLELAPYQHWRHALAHAASEGDPALHSLLALAPVEAAAAEWIHYLARHSFDTHNAQSELAPSGLHCPPIDAPFFERMVADSVRRGLLILPDTITSTPERLSLHAHQHAIL